MTNNSFDDIAIGYDAEFTDSTIGKIQRGIVQQYLKKNLSPASEILEINCGTGTDAQFLAQQGHRVTFTDASPNMIAIAKNKTDGLRGIVSGFVWDMRKPFPLQSIKYDYIFSNFGGLNCLSPQELNILAIQLTNRLNDKGKCIFIVMGRKCLWERIYFIAKGKPESAFRRNSKIAVQARLNSETTLDIWYYSPAEIIESFSSGFSVTHHKPVGFFIPPSYFNKLIGNKNIGIRMLVFLEGCFRNWSLLSNRSDHYLITLQKRA